MMGVEQAEVRALNALKKGAGRHALEPQSGFSEAEVVFHIDDLHAATVNLLLGSRAVYSFKVEVRILGRNPNPDELWESSENGKEQAP